MQYLKLTDEEKARHPSIHYTGSIRGMKKPDIGESVTAVSGAGSIFIIFQSQ